MEERWRMAVIAETWAFGIRHVEVWGAEESSRKVRRVKANAPSSPPVMRRVVVGERGVVIRLLILFWWRGILVFQVKVARGVRAFEFVVLVILEPLERVILWADSDSVKGQNAMWPSVLAVSR